MKQTDKKPGQSLYTSVLLLLLALASVTAATTAWLSLADHTRVRSMALDVTAGNNLRFDLDPHETMEEYTRTLSFESIAARIQDERGFDPALVPLDPVTTNNYVDFSFQNGEAVSVNSGSYLEFTLHFIANRDMIVHLTSENSDLAKDGTAVSSNVPQLPQALRIGFFDGDTGYIYRPGMDGGSTIVYGAKNFGLPDGDRMVYNQDNAMFFLEAYVNKPIVVRVWLEGEDEACTDEIQNADYQIQLRFEGTDESNNLIRNEYGKSSKQKG